MRSSWERCSVTCDFLISSNKRWSHLSMDTVQGRSIWIPFGNFFFSKFSFFRKGCTVFFQMIIMRKMKNEKLWTWNLKKSRTAFKLDNPYAVFTSIWSKQCYSRHTFTVYFCVSHCISELANNLTCPIEIIRLGNLIQRNSMLQGKKWNCVSIHAFHRKTLYIKEYMRKIHLKSLGVPISCVYFKIIFAKNHLNLSKMFAQCERILCIHWMWLYRNVNWNLIIKSNSNGRNSKSINNIHVHALVLGFDSCNRIWWIFKAIGQQVWWRLCSSECRTFSHLNAKITFWASLWVHVCVCILCKEMKCDKSRWWIHSISICTLYRIFFTFFSFLAVLPCILVHYKQGCGMIRQYTMVSS